MNRNMVIMLEWRCPLMWEIRIYCSEGYFTDKMKEHFTKVYSEKGIGKQRGIGFLNTGSNELCYSPCINLTIRRDIL
jgi:hypothetical protein